MMRVVYSWVRTGFVIDQSEICIFVMVLGPVVRKPDSAIHWIVSFSTFSKLAIDRYNLGLCYVLELSHMIL